MSSSSWFVEVLQGTVKDLAQVFDQFFCHCWSLGLSQGKAELVSHSFFLQDLRPGGPFITVAYTQNVNVRTYVRNIYNCCVRTKQDLKEAYVASQAKVGIYKNKLDCRNCRVPDLDIGPVHSNSADLTIMFMANDKSDKETVLLVIMPFSK